MIRALSIRPRIMLTCLLAILAASALYLTVADATRLLPSSRWWSAIMSPDLADPAELIARHSFLPRVLVALFGGGALALAGSLLQQALRNPLADPTTVGASAGAGLALAAVTLYAPGLLKGGREAIAFAGAAATTIVAIGASARSAFSPVTLILSGMIVSLVAGSATAFMMAISTDYVAELFIWQSGSLVQIGDGPALALGVRFALASLIVAGLVKPLNLLGLGDAAATSLGSSPILTRIVAVFVALALTAAVAAAAGVIAFVGLAAPSLVRLTGIRGFGERTVWAVGIGATLLWLTDRIALVLPFSSDVPAGSITALLGAPLLLLLLPKAASGGDRASPSLAKATHDGGPIVFAVAACAVAATLVVAVLLGRSGAGWTWFPSAEILALRAPRVVSSLAAGSLLAVAGVVLQRLTGNPIAAPEMVGASAGATLGILVLLGTTTVLHQSAVTGAAVAGSLAAIAFVMTVARGTGFRADRWMLAGVSLSTLASGMAAIALASGDPRVGWLQTWLTGSTYAATSSGAIAASIAALAVVAAAMALHRWLSIMRLGPVAGAVGVSVPLARGTLLMLAALATGFATVLVGPLSFVGLIAPHLATTFGFRQVRPQLLAATAFGGCVFVLADWIGRQIVYPWQIPAALVAALIGGSYMLIRLSRAME